MKQMTVDDLNGKTSEDDLAELGGHADRSVAEFCHHIDASWESVNEGIRRVGEAVAKLDEKIDRSFKNTRDEMRRGFSETQAMLRDLISSRWPDAP